MERRQVWLRFSFVVLHSQRYNYPFVAPLPDNLWYPFVVAGAKLDGLQGLVLGWTLAVPRPEVRRCYLVATAVMPIRTPAN
jgi:hypothetical protein